MEWQGRKKGRRAVSLRMDSAKKHIQLREAEGGNLLRTVDVSMLDQEGSVMVALANDGKGSMLMLTVPREYDVVSRALSFVFKGAGCCGSPCSLYSRMYDIVSYPVICIQGSRML